MEKNRATVINISIETHNSEDYYYKEYYNNVFVTYLDNNKIKEVLKSIIPKEYINKDKYCSCLDIKDIDYEDLKKQLMKNEIYPLTIDKEWTYYLKDDKE